MRTRIAATTVGLLIAVGLAVPALAAPSYTVVDLGTFGGKMSMAYAVNDLGQVVGVSQYADGTFDAFIWSPATGMQPLGFGRVINADSVAAQGIDDAGRVVGYVAIGGQRQALLWDPIDGVQPLGAPGMNATAYAIDETGGIAGTYPTSAGTAHAFRMAGPGAEMVDLGTLGGAVSGGRAINATGQVAGTSWTPASEEHAVLFAEGAVTDLGRFASQAPRSWGMGINDAGQVVGMSSSGTRAWQRAFVWTAATGLVDLGWLPDPKNHQHAFAYDINNSGQVVGMSNGRAFLWTAATGMLDLNNLIPKRSGWTLERGYAVNDAGWIVGVGQIRQRTHAFVLIPS